MIWRPFIKRGGVALLCLLACCAVAGADQYHYINTLVGSRSAGLAGAFTALSDDTAGCYYNPAGIAMVSATSISASVNAYHKSTKIYENVLRESNGRYQDWEQESSVLLPNFFGIVKKLGAGMLGLSYAVPDSTLRRQNQSFSNIQSSIVGNPIERFIINIDDKDQTYLFGPSYGLRISDNLSIGATLYAYYRDKRIIRNQTLFFEQGEHLWSNYYDTQEDWGYQPIVGLIWEPLEKIALGLALSRTFIVSSDREQQLLRRDTTSPEFSDTNALSLSISAQSEETDYPVTARLGAAYFVSPRLLFSADVIYTAAIDEKSAVWNAALGVEYYFRDNLALRAGLYSDMANTDELTRGAVNQVEHVDIYGASLSLSMFHGPSSITLGASYGYGGGEAQIIDGDISIQDVEIRNISVFLAASYSF
ncbi:MAG: hypothetical protein C4519_18905 [Desulfobacteraceae bacterium]|nr:MAG: hypothetical protein C4519_18905 [Desulfobacteraceae bacterium]